MKYEVREKTVQKQDRLVRRKIGAEIYNIGIQKNPEIKFCLVRILQQAVPSKTLATYEARHRGKLCCRRVGSADASIRCGSHPEAELRGILRRYNNSRLEIRY